MPVMNSSLFENRTTAGRQGFSLVELLTVMAIMSVFTALAAGVIHVRTGNPAAAAQIVAACSNAAQADAIATGMPARVIICIDPGAGPKNLRYVANLVEDPTLTVAGGPTYWKLSAKPLLLPEGTVFLNDPDYSSTTDTMQFDVTNNQTSQSGDTGVTCTYIEFDPMGQTTNTQNNIQWIFEHALQTADNTIVGVNKNDLDGFIVRRLGKFVYFQSPDQISKPAQ